MTLSRRQFIAASAATAAGVTTVPRRLSAETLHLPNRKNTRRTSPNDWLPEPPPASQLRAFARIAMDAARGAGADFADIRIGAQRRVTVYGYPRGPEVMWTMGYGVRAWRNGTWSFQHGNVMTADAVAWTARNAAAGARIYAGVNAQLATHRHASTSNVLRADTAWAPAPVVTGEWRVPIQIDPFLVALDDYQAVIGTLSDAVVPANVWRNARALGYVLEWQGERRVFASTEGSLVTQETICGGLQIQASAGLEGEREGIGFHTRTLGRVCAGFETVIRPEIPAVLQQAYDDVVRWRELPRRPFREVGRFPIVFDGITMASIVGCTIDTALDGDRVSGLEADASGSSFLSPPDAILSASEPQFSPLLNATVHRTLPSPTAVQWDDDGVVPEPYTVLQQGRVTDYHTTRETAPMLAAFLERHGRPLRSHGCAVAPTPESVPRGTGGHLTVAPSSTTATVTDLMRDLSHGFLVINGAADATAGLTAGTVVPRMDGIVVEIRRGVPVSRTGLRMQFLTNTLLKKNLVALGDATTVGTDVIEASKGIPWQPVSQWVTSPAALCGDVDVVL